VLLTWSHVWMAAASALRRHAGTSAAEAQLKEDNVRDRDSTGGNTGVKEDHPAAVAQSSNMSEAVLMFLLIQLTNGPLSITCARMRHTSMELHA
jgi:hypothetical protein